MEAKNNPVHLRLSLSSSRPPQLSRHTYLFYMMGGGEGGGGDLTTCCPINIFTCTPARGHMFTAAPCLVLFLRMQIQNQAQLHRPLFLLQPAIPCFLIVCDECTLTLTKLCCVIFFFFFCSAGRSRAGLQHAIALTHFDRTEQNRTDNGQFIFVI